MTDTASEQETNERPAKWVRVGLAVVLLAAVAVRVVYVAQAAGGPLVDLHRWPQSDMHFFDRWGGLVAEGDWLTDQALHPQHKWHRRVAEQVLGSDDPAQAKALWDRWYGGKRFHQEPLYPYLLAVTYRVAGRDARWVFAWQALGGLASIVLLFRITRRAFGDAAGVVAAAMAALYGPLLFYEGVLLRASLMAAVGLLLVDLTQTAMQRDGRWRWFALGAAAGVSVLLKAVFVLYAAAVGAALLFRHRRKAAAMAGGFALVMLPLLVRNVAVGAPPFGLSSVGAVTFICSNGPDYQPGEGFWTREPYVARVMDESDGRLGPAIVRTLSLHDGVGSYLRQLSGKAWAMFSWHEAPNNTNFYFHRLFAPVLRWLPLSFGLLAPLGLAGMVLAWRRSAARPLLLLVVVSAAPLLVFYVLSRFRVALAAALLPFAAMAVVQWLQWVRACRWRPAMLMLVLTGALTGVIFAHGPDKTSLLRSDDFGAAWIGHYRPAVQQAIGAGDTSGALRKLEQLLHHEPALVGELGPNRPARDETESDFAKTFAEFYQGYALILRDAGRIAQARAAQQRADELRAAATTYTSAE